MRRDEGKEKEGERDAVFMIKELERIVRPEILPLAEDWRPYTDKIRCHTLATKLLVRMSRCTTGAVYTTTYVLL